MAQTGVAYLSTPQEGAAEESTKNVFAQLSTQAELSIGKVVKELSHEFPTISISKLRFLEERGIVTPHRSPAGYRKYSQVDMARLRYCLRAQRDQYLPLSVICENLAAMARGETAEIPQPARIVAKDGKLIADQTEGRITLRELLDATGLSMEDLERYRKAKLITPDLSGRFPARSHQVIRLVMELEKKGIAPSQLTFLQTNADRLADLLGLSEDLHHPKKNGIERERRLAQLTEQSQVASELFRQLLLGAIH